MSAEYNLLQDDVARQTISGTGEENADNPSIRQHSPSYDQKSLKSPIIKNEYTKSYEPDDQQKLLDGDTIQARNTEVDTFAENHIESD